MITIFLLAGGAVTYGQVFSNQEISAAGSWNGTLVKTINVTGLPILQNGIFELAQVNLHLGDDANTRNYGTYNITLTKGATVIDLVAVGGFPNAIIRQIDTKFRFNTYLRRLVDHGSTTQPFAIGYYRSEDNFQLLNGLDPNGTWTVTITETSVASGARFNNIDLVFRQPFTVTDYTTLNSYDNCSTPYCLGTSEIIVASNNNFTPQSTDLFNANTLGCDWNAAQNNSAWFKFIAADSQAKITISGITGNLQILGVDAGADENPCTPGDNSVITGGCPDDSNNDTYFAPQYFNGSTRNNQLNLSGLTVGNTYYFLVDGTGGAVSPFYIEIEGASVDCSNCTFKPIITANSPVCPGQNLVLTCSDGTSWLWTGPNGFTSTDQNPVISNFSAANEGIYQVIVTQDGCEETKEIAVTASIPIDPQFNPIAPICLGGTLAPLPTISINGIEGTWAPPLNNTSTTTYNFTPNDGICASTTTLTISVGDTITPTFDNIAPVCQGTQIAPLPTTSVEGIPGSWSPPLNNAQTTVYTFTPNDSACANSTTLTIIIEDNIIPTFNSIAPICSGDNISELPTTSIEGIQGTWAPTLNNTQTTTYTFTPNDGQCASSTTLTITVNELQTPIFSYTNLDLCENAPFIQPLLQNVSNNNITGTWFPASISTSILGTTTYTFTPDSGQCASTTSFTVTITSEVTPIFSPVGPICAGATLNPLPTISINNIVGTWNPALNNTQTTTYTFTPNDGQCASSTTLTITVNELQTPIFSYTNLDLCENAPFIQPLLQNVSNNNITGTWFPASISTSILGTTTYTFTPDSGQCASTTSFTVTITPEVTPIFSPVGPICAGEIIPELPTTSLNGIEGSWSPALNTVQTTIYTFTPNDGQCAQSASLEITVNSTVIPTFAPVAAICLGATLNPLPTTSINGIEGTWSPELNNTQTTNYTFTPNNGQCAQSATLEVVVNSIIAPLFTLPDEICEGDVIKPLPSVSDNGISGTWSPSLNNTATTTYTFTPADSQCAASYLYTLQVNAKVDVTFNFNSITTLCIGQNFDLPQISSNGIEGSWSPAVIDSSNPGSFQYIFTPNLLACANSYILTVTVENVNAVNLNLGCDGSVFKAAATGAPTATFEWFTASGDAIGNDADVEINSAGNYVLIATQNGCNIEIPFTVDNTFCEIPKGISPNDDGLNDTWDLTNLNVSKAQIFNRYGIEVYSKSSYTNEWGGTDKKGNPLPGGTYYFVVTFDNGKQKTGWVYLLRGN